MLIFANKNGSGIKIRFHNPKRLLYPPKSPIRLSYFPFIIVKFTGDDTEIAVIHRVFLRLLQIHTAQLFRVLQNLASFLVNDIFFCVFIDALFDAIGIVPDGARGLFKLFFPLAPRQVRFGLAPKQKHFSCPYFFFPVLVLPRVFFRKQLVSICGIFIQCPAKFVGF